MRKEIQKRSSFKVNEVDLNPNVGMDTSDEYYALWIQSQANSESIMAAANPFDQDTNITRVR